MKKRQGIGISKILWMLMATVMIIFLVQVHAQAQCVMTDGTGTLDTDCDGFKDTEETVIVQCLTGQVTQIACEPAKKDLFIILLPMATNSLLPPNPLSMLSTSGQANLATTVHQISPEQVSSDVRNVTSAQKAVRMIEFGGSNAYMGYSLPGTPNTTANAAYVYTNQISTTIDNLCGPTKPCKDADAVTVTKQSVKDKYIKHTIAHETGHMMNLRGGCTTDSGCHYPSQTNVILDASVSYVSSGGGKKFYIGSIFTAEDSSYVLLR